MKKIGLVLSGGGGKGAYEIGVWKALTQMKISENTSLADKISVVSGTSVGALNAALFSAHKLDLATTIWSNISDEQLKQYKFKEDCENIWKAICNLLENLQQMDFSNIEVKLSSIIEESLFNIQNIPTYIEELLSSIKLTEISQEVFNKLPQLAFLVICIAIPIPTPLKYFPSCYLVPAYELNIYYIIRYFVKLGIPISQISEMFPQYFELLRGGVFTNVGLSSLISQAFPNKYLPQDAIPCIVTAENTDTIYDPLNTKMAISNFSSKIAATLKLELPIDVSLKSLDIEVLTSNKAADYFVLNNASDNTFLNLLLASSALPPAFPEITINGTIYIDGGTPPYGDNTPIYPLVNSDYNCTALIVVHLKKDDLKMKSYEMNFPNVDIINIYPSKNLGGLFKGTLNFDKSSAIANMQLGEDDAMRILQENQEKILSWLQSN